VRYGETDQMGVVHHANYLAYMEEARTTFMASLGCPYSEIEKRGIGLPVRKLDVRYWSPAYYEQTLVVGVEVVHLGAASIVFGYEIRCAQHEQRIATGRVELACVRLTGETRGPCTLPDDLRSVLVAAADA